MTNPFKAEAHLDLTGNLDSKLADAVAQLKALDNGLTEFGKRFTELTTKLGQLDPGGGIAKLGKTLNPAGLIVEIDQVEARVTKFQGFMAGIGKASKQVAEDSLKFMTPLNQAIERAKNDVEALGRGLSQAQAGGKEEKKPFIDHFGTALTTIQQRLGYIEMALKPAEAMISESAALQSALIRFQINAGANKNDMDTLRKVVETAREGTQLSPLNEANVLEMIADLVGPKPEDAAKLLPVFNNFADAQMLMHKSTSYEQSAGDLRTLIRQAGITDPAEIAAYADMFNRASLLVPGDTASFTESVKTSAPEMKNELGMSNQDILLANVAANWLGMSDTRSLVDALSRTVAGGGEVGRDGKPSEPQKKVDAALKEIGILDNQGHSTVLDGGQLNFQKFVQRLSEFETNAFKDIKDPQELAAARQKVSATLRTAFDKVEYVGGSLADPKVVDQILQASKHLNDFGVKDIQKRFNDDSVERQRATAKANADTVLVEMGTQTLPTVNATLKAFNGLLSGINGYLRHDPQFATELGFITLGTSGLLAGLGLGGLFKGVSGGLFGLAEGAPGVASALPKVGAGEAGITDEALAWIGLGADATAAGAAPELAAGAAAAPETVAGGAALLSNPIGWGTLLGAALIGGSYEMNSWTYDYLSRTTKGAPGESEEERQEDIIGGMAGGVVFPHWQEKPKLEDRPKQIDTYGGWGLVGKWLGLHHMVDNLDAVPAIDPTALKPAAAPPTPAPYSPLDLIHHTAFTMPGDGRGPTVERAAALSNADASAKAQAVNVQVQPGQVIVQLDGHAIATAVMEFIARQVGGPNTGPSAHDPFQAYTPPGGLIHGMAT